MILKISNKWLLDINELRLMGCSAKSWESTIGRFGTWLKYAIAVLVRENIDFAIYIGTRKVEIQQEEIIIRDNAFQKIIIDYQSTSITTNLWVEWDVGQWLREFIANALDEDWSYEVVDSFDTCDRETTVVFDYDQVKEYLDDFDFDDWIEVSYWYYYKKLDTPRRAKVFKQWFLVYEANDDSSYDYRIDDLKINESRMAEDRHEVKRGIAKIQTLMDKEDVEVIVENKETDLGIFYSHDDLWKWWDEVKKKDIWKNDGYELQQVVSRNSNKYTDSCRVDLVFSSRVNVTHDNELKPWIFLQDEDFDEEWDYDMDTGFIYLWLQRNAEYHIGHTTAIDEFDYSEIIREARRYKKAAMYVKENKLKTAVDTASHFLDKQMINTWVWVLGTITLNDVTDRVYLNTNTKL